MVSHTFQWNYHGSDVRVTGDFDNWTASTTMERNTEGHFSKVIDLPANTKVYYKFVVDGNWCVDGQALKEGEGAHENNYILTGAHQSSEKTLAAEPDAPLPVLGPGAAYVDSQVGTAVAPQSSATFVDPPKHVISTPATSVVAGGTPATAATSSAVKETEYDDSGPSPSDPQAVRNARDNPLAEAYTDAIDHLPTREEVVHEVQHAVEIAGGFLAAGLAAGAAAFGLSTQASHTESTPITGAAKTTAEPESITSTIKNALTSTTAPATTSTTDTTAPRSVSASQTGTLEQAAVAAATSAATNAYNASGLSGLSGVTAPVSSLSKDGSVGFTGIGTAVNQETGVVGTSKIVQGVNDIKATEETHTAQFPGETAGALLQDHQNGAKVERINDHAVLAEVGIGGAAIGTALVTDKTVSSSSGLAIPSQAAEHLPSAVDSSEATTAAAREAIASSVGSTSRPTPVTADSGLAPALSRDTAPVEAVAPTSEATLVPAPVLQSTQAVPKDEVIAPAEARATTVPGTTSSVPAAASSASEPASSAPVNATSTVPAVSGTTAKASGAKSTGTNNLGTTAQSAASASKIAASEVTPAKVRESSVSVPAQASAPVTAQAATPASPSKAAAQAASKSSTARQSARTQVPSESTTEEGGKKKKGLLKRMKSMFNSKK